MSRRGKAITAAKRYREQQDAAVRNYPAHIDEYLAFIAEHDPRTIATDLQDLLAPTNWDAPKPKWAHMRPDQVDSLLACCLQQPSERQARLASFEVVHAFAVHATDQASFKELLEALPETSRTSFLQTVNDAEDGGSDRTASVGAVRIRTAIHEINP